MRPDLSPNGERKRPEPSLEQVLARAQADEAYWTRRNERMWRHQEMVLNRGKASDRGKLIVRLNDPRVLIEKTSGLIARREHRIEVPPKGDGNSRVAQRIENALRWWRGHQAREWAEGLHNPLAYDEAQSLLLRGWIAERLMLDPDDPTYTNVQVFDPLCVFPRVAGRRISRVCHVYQATVAQVVGDFPEAAEVLGDDEDRYVRVVGYYEATAPYWYGVVADGRWVKEPVRLGYFPWLLTVAKGAMSHQVYGIGENTAQDLSEHIGESFLESVEAMVRTMDIFVTILANATAKQENPPKIVTTVDGQLKEVDLSTGATSTLVVGESVQVLEIGPKIGQLLPLLQTLQDRINKGGLPSAMFGEGTSLESGFMSALLMGAAQDTLWTFIKAIESFYARRYTRFLEIFRDYAGGLMEIVAPAAAGIEKVGIAKGQRVWSEMLTPDDVRANGTYVEVTYEDISPADRVALGNLAALLVREKLIDLRTAREKYLGLDDPDLINDRVLGDLVYLNEAAVKQLAELNLLRLGRIPELAALQQAKAEQEAQAAQQAQMAQAGPPAPPIRGQAAGLPPGVLPPQMTGAVNPAPSEEEMMAQMMGADGMGMAGMPIGG